MSKPLKIIAFISAVVLILSLGAIFVTYAIVKDTVIDENKLIKNTQTIEIYSACGNLIAKKNSKNSGDYIKIKNLKDYTKNAFIAIEDKRFYSHNGIDIKRIFGATLENIKSASFKEGASTITQQLIKNTHLSSEKTVKRKLQEIKLALNLEKRYSKDEILEMYLNSIYFGKGAYGIEDASKTYFNKSASELTLNESAMLAGIIKAPNTYSPDGNYDLAVKRKNLVLKVMSNCGFITDKEYNLNLNKPVKLSTTIGINLYDDYVKAVISEFENSNIFMPYGNNVVKIYTYLDEDLQSSISHANVDYDEIKIVINSKINGVTAFYGNNSNLKRSPASCVKPWLVYAPMINDGYVKESTIVDDERIDYNGYSPKNFDGKYHGSVTVKYALSNSLNVPAVKLLNGYGIEKANKYTKNMNLDIENESLPCALGGLSGGLTLKELCDKYSVFNNAGNYSESKFIRSIYFDGIKIYSHTPKSNKVFSEETAFIVNDILKNSVKNGTSKKLRSLPYEICAKTGTNGTTNGNLDALSVAYTTDAIVGVWVGNYDNKIMPNSVTGGNEPTSISRNVFEVLYKNTTPLPFSKPDSVIEVSIDKTELLLNKKEVISSQGEKFYYIKGSEPTEIINKNPLLFNVKINLSNGIVNIDYECENVDSIEIYKTYNGTTRCVYKGVPINKFIEKLNDFGVYNYKLVASNSGANSSFELPSVKYDKRSITIIESDKWLYS